MFFPQTNLMNYPHDIFAIHSQAREMKTGKKGGGYPLPLYTLTHHASISNSVNIVRCGGCKVEYIMMHDKSSYIRMNQGHAPTAILSRSLLYYDFSLSRLHTHMRPRSYHIQISTASSLEISFANVPPNYKPTKPRRRQRRREPLQPPT